MTDPVTTSETTPAPEAPTFDFVQPDPGRTTAISSIKVDPPLALSEGDRINVSVTPASAATSPGKSVRWAPDLDQIEQDIQHAIAMLPTVDDPPPLVKDFESPVFWTTTVLPIVLAIVAYCFHQDLSPLSVALAAIGASITTLGYTVYRGLYRHSHAVALTTASAIRSNQVRDAVALATTGHLAA